MTPVVPLQPCSVPPSGVRSVAKLVPGYAGPCLRAIRAADGAEAEIGFNGEGRVDLSAARRLAGTPRLSAGVLWLKTWFDQAGSNHLYGVPGAYPSLCSERDAFGGSFADDAFILQDGAKDRYPAPLSRALLYPKSFQSDIGSFAAFLVARPTVSLSGNAWLTLGDPATGTFLSLFTAERSPSTPGGLTLAVSTEAGEKWIGIGDITAVPRVNRHCLGVVTRPDTITVFSEQRALAPVMPSRGGILAVGLSGVGATGVSGFHAANDLYASVDFPGSIAEVEVHEILRVLSATFDTGRRKNRFIADGSSTPRGQGADANICYPKLVQGMLDRPIDIFNIAVNGYTIDDLVANCPTRVLPLIEVDVNCLYCPDGITNSIARGDKADAVYAKLTDLCRTVGAAGAKVIAPTAKNRGDLRAGEQVERERLNQLIRSNWRGELRADGLLDIDGIPETRDPADGRYFQPDGVHNNNPVHAAIARMAAAIVQSLLV